jgi:hypothetical protein
MGAFGWILTIAGAALFLTALQLTLRANANTPVPFYGPPAIAPRGTLALRTLGAALFVLGAVMLTSTIGAWSFALMIVAPAASLIAILAHNRRVANRGR